VFALRDGHEFGAYPGDGGFDQALIGDFTVHPQVALPAADEFQALHHGTHKGEVAQM
jgi:hypothetical protein